MHVACYVLSAIAVLLGFVFESRNGFTSAYVCAATLFVGGALVQVIHSRAGELLRIAERVERLQVLSDVAMQKRATSTRPSPPSSAQAEPTAIEPSLDFLTSFPAAKSGGRPQRS